MEAFLNWLVCVVVLLTLFWLTICWDKYRIRRHIRLRGGERISSEWQLFGYGWIGQGSTRAYVVSWVDKKGSEHHATCRTAWLGGVFFAEHVVVEDVIEGNVVSGHPSAPEDSSAHETIRRVETENEALRAEIARLRRGE